MSPKRVNIYSVWSKQTGLQISSLPSYSQKVRFMRLVQVTSIPRKGFGHVYKVQTVLQFWQFEMFSTNTLRMAVIQIQ